MSGTLSWRYLAPQSSQWEILCGRPRSSRGPGRRLPGSFLQSSRARERKRRAWAATGAEIGVTGTDEECQCCGAHHPHNKMVHLGNHPEVAPCVRCDHFVSKEAGKIAEPEGTLVRRSSATCSAASGAVMSNIEQHRAIRHPSHPACPRTPCVKATWNLESQGLEWPPGRTRTCQARPLSPELPIIAYPSQLAIKPWPGCSRLPS